MPLGHLRPPRGLSQCLPTLGVKKHFSMPGLSPPAASRSLRELQGTAQPPRPALPKPSLAVHTSALPSSSSSSSRFQVPSRPFHVVEPTAAHRFGVRPDHSRSPLPMQQHTAVFPHSYKQYIKHISSFYKLQFVTQLQILFSILISCKYKK